jgi:HD-GYP domain-containing protein (c-di-GMP phosphodiesterase class II)
MAGYASSQMGYSIIGLLMAALWAGGVGPLAAILILLPLLIARWAIQQHADEYAAYEATIRSLVRAVEAKDLYTRGHSERVAKASVLIAHQIAMREDRVDALRYAGILHDVGKMGVPTSVLRKSGKLSAEEFEAIKQHPVLGLEMVHNIDFLAEAHAGILHHHERMDGRGYPHGLVGDQIPEFARVIAVADAFDAMTSTRSYRDARPVDEALLELRRWAGSQFDPVMVQALISAVERHGWEPADTPEKIRREATGVSALADHDDPAVSNGEVSEGAELTSLP